MKRLLIKSLILGFPAFLWIVLVIVIDPFDYFNISHVVPNEIKKHNAQEINTLYFHAFQAANAPSPNVLIGDSRTAELPIDEIQKLSGEQYKLLTASGLKINEITDLFWLANKQRKLKNVYIGINFSMFNEYAYADRVKSVQTILDNPFRYIFNPNTSQALYYIVESLILGHQVVDSTPPMTRQEFWDYIVTVRAGEWYGKYKFPSEAYSEMGKMVKYCNDNGIHLTFIIVPHHVEFQSRLWDFGLTRDKAQFLAAMLALNTRTIDYDYINEITLGKDNFRDAIHYSDEIGKLIVREVWTNDLRVGKLLDRDWVTQVSAKELEGVEPPELEQFQRARQLSSNDQPQ